MLYSINVITGPDEERALITGLHVVCDLYCSCCKNIVGWKYVDAQEETQKYKIGKYILEKAKIKKESNFFNTSAESPTTTTTTSISFGTELQSTVSTQTTPRGISRLTLVVSQGEDDESEEDDSDE